MNQNDAYLIHLTGLDIENRIIYLNGEDLVENSEPGVDYRMSSKFIKNINILSNKYGVNDPITIHMNTIGGEWSYGMAIYDAIKSFNGKVTIIAHSWARSMSSIILQAASDGERKITKNAAFMVHFGTASEDGHYVAVKSSIEYQVKTEHIMLSIYANRCKNGEFFVQNNYNEQNTYDYILSKIEKKSDWWMTSQEALYYGFVDKII